MNLISITIFLLFLNLVTPTPYQINDKEKTAIQYLARIYAMLMNTFDPREVSEDFLILEQNQQEINDFSSVAIYLITRLETDDEISRVPKYLRLEIFWGEVSSYNQHLHFDNKPMTFRLFKQMFHSVIQKGLIRPNEEYCIESDRQDLITEQQIREAIDRIDINDIDRTNTKLNKALPNELFNHTINENTIKYLKDLKDLENCFHCQEYSDTKCYKCDRIVCNKCYEINSHV